MIDYPELPDGWTAEPVSSRHTMFRSPKGLMVTVDFDKRTFRAGLATSGRVQALTTYTGRGWKRRLCDDAKRWLAELDQSPF